MTATPPRVEDLLRQLGPVALGVLVRRYGDFAACEDAVQEALIAASTSWPSDGLPTNPTGWLITTGSRRLIEIWRNEAARRRREIDDATRALRPPTFRQSRPMTRWRCSCSAAIRY